MAGPRRRNIKAGKMPDEDEQKPLLEQGRTKRPPSSVQAMSQWITLALASGACAAFNGVFAKLTTTEMTSSLAGSVAGAIGLTRENKFVELLLRAMFFALNLVFNGMMWALFTAALTRATSSTRVSVVNTSSNFVITAVLGFLIFGESLPPLWWLGAALLVAGNVIIGRRDGEENKGGGDPLPGTVQGIPVEEVPLVEIGEEEDEEDETES